MEVVDKIERLYETETTLPIFDINSHFARFSVGYPQHNYKCWIVGCFPQSPEKFKENSKIEATFRVAVEFLNWHKKIPKITK